MGTPGTDSLRGVFPYIATPFDGEGQVSEPRLRAMVDRVMDAGVHGLVPLGSTGELPYLSLDQRAAVIDICVDQVAGRVPVVPGVCGFSTAETVEQAVRAEAVGADGLLVVLNAYTELSRSEVLSFFEVVAGATSLPVVVYHHPRLCHVRIDLDLALALAEIPNLVAIKDASGSLDLFSASPTLAAAGVSMFAATAISPTAAMLLGAVGWMSGPACLLPAETVAMYGLCGDSRWEDALALERQMQPLLDLFRRYGPGASVKAMLRADGFDVGHPAHPVAMPEIEGLAELLATAHVEMDRILAELPAQARSAAGR